MRLCRSGYGDAESVYFDLILAFSVDDLLFIDVLMAMKMRLAAF